VLSFTAVKYSQYVLDFIFTCIDTPPGIGKITNFKNNVSVQTSAGKLRLNYIKTPCIDLDVCFIENFENMNFENSLMMSSNDFKNNYPNIHYHPTTKFNFGIIGDILYPRDFMRKDKLVGFITSPFDDLYYIFVYENNEIIDYKKLFEQYELAIDGFQKLDELD
jgi:hypothetical protein